MKAFVVERYGDAGVVRAGEMPDPPLGEDDVLVEIHAASVNPLDLKTRDGAFKAILRYRVPFVLGNDLAGVVVAVGARVSRFAVGDEVSARPDKNRIGAFAELIAIHQDDLATKPTTLTMEEAASIPLVGLTSSGRPEPGRAAADRTRPFRARSTGPQVIRRRRTTTRKPAHSTYGRPTWDQPEVIRSPQARRTRTQPPAPCP
jgi:NADPH:quinone reductase-like Zn-dependent oxidoreductase